MLVLAELTPLNASSGSRVTLRAASADDRNITGLNAVRWWPAIKDVGPLSLRLFDGDFSSAPDVGALTLTVLTDKLARLDAGSRAYRWAGAGVKIYAGKSGDAWPWTQWLEGKVDGFDAQANQLRLRVKVNTEPFDKNVLTATYAGTGGIEGGADLKNKVKPWCFGRALNVEPVLIDATNSVYQFSAYGPIQAVNTLYERASDFGAALGDYASYTALVAATIPAGRWGTCLASGLIRLGAPPYGLITGDVDGDKPSTWLRKTGEIITRIATNAGISGGLLDTASLAALDTAVPYNINLFLDDQTTVLDLAQRLARPCNAQAGISWLGKLFATRVAIGTPALTLDTQGRQKPGVIASTESDVSPPYWRVEMGAQRAWRVHSFDEIAFSAPLVNRGAYSATETYREGNIVQDQSSSWIYVNPTPASGNAPPTLPTTSNAYWSIMVQGGMGTGPAGADGLNSMMVQLYQRSPTSPSVPAGSLTYTFATGGLTGTLGSWTRTIPAGTDPIWVIQALATATAATDAIASADWSTPAIMATNGVTGASGQNTAPVYLYQRSASAPSLPSSTLTYTFASGVLTGTLGSWSQGVPATNGLPLWVTLATATGTGATDTIAAGEWAATVTMTTDGVNSASVFLYQRNTTGVAPSLPSLITTYTFNTAVLTNINNGWSQGVPDVSNGAYLWVTTASALSTTATDTISASEWATAQIMAQNGAAGAAGANAAIVYLYQRAASLPTLPASTTTYTFATSILSGTLGSWSQTVPADNGLPLYVTTASATGTGATDTIGAGEWATPVVFTLDGTDGLNTATVYLFQRATSTPAVPSTTTTYTFATGVLSGTLAGWTQSIPAGTNPVYVTTATALSTGATDSIGAGEWASPNIIAQNGLDGTYSWTPVLINIARSGSTFTPTASDGLNNGTFPGRGYSAEKQIGLGVGATGISPTANNYVIGLDVNPSSVANYTDIDFAVVPGNGNINIFTGGSSIGVVGTFGTADVLAVEHRGSSVVALKNGTTLYTWSGVSASVPLGACFGFDSGGTMQVAVYKSGLDGAAGANGLNSATVNLYQRAASAPSVPGTSLTYTFASGALSGTLGSWTQSVPADNGLPLYVITAVASGTGSTDSVATSDWTTPQILAQSGASGSAGLSSAIVTLYKRGTSSPAVPSTTLTYTFATGILSGTLAGWTQTIPAGTDPIYATTAPASSTGSTDTILTSEWASPTVIAQNGAQVISVYRRGSVQPATPTGNGTPTGWATTPVDSAGDFAPITTTGMATNADFSSFTRTQAGTADWSESFRSSTSGIGMAVGFRPAQADKRFMIGLNTDPLTNNSYTSLDYALHCSQTGALEAWSNNALSASLGSYTSSDAFTVEHRNTTVVITKNGSVIQTWTGVGAATAFYVDSSFGDVGGKVTGVFVGNGALWISEAVQDLAGNTSGSWSTPIQFIAAPASDGNYRDIKFQRSLSQPATPTGDNPTGWFDSPPAGTDAIWMIIGVKSFAGALVGSWSTPQSISGLTPRGEYSSSATYYSNNTVTSNGGSYVAVQDNFSGHAPSGTGQANSWWDVLAAPGPPGTPAVPPSPVSATINLTSSTGTVNLRSIADANGYTGSSDAAITFNVPNGVTIRGLSGGSGIDTGSWPTSSYSISLSLVVQSGGIVDGGGGPGGAGGSVGGGAAGGDAGDAIFCRLAASVTINAGGTVRGGGGGGNGGDALGRMTGGEFLYKGGSGGGGGFPNGAGGPAGTGDISTGNAGSAGTTSGGGAGGAAVSGAGAGFNGGAAGTAAGFGGAAGYAVRKNGFSVTVSNSGTMTGSAA